MPFLPDTTTSELWLPTSSLPRTNPYGITSSPDGSKLYVTCANGGADGAVVQIDVATKAVTTLQVGLEFVKQGIDVTSDGDVFWTFGPNNVGALKALRRWNGSSVSILSWETNSIFGMCVGPSDEFCVEYRQARPTELRRYTEGGTLLTTGTPFGDPQDAQFRGFETTSDRLLTCNPETFSAYVNNLTTGAAITAFSPGGAGGLGAPIDLAAYADDEVYLLTVGGRIWRWDPAASATLIDSGLPEEANTTGLGVSGSYGGMCITSTNRCFVVRGGWAASSSGGNPFDASFGTDVGIYEVFGGATGWRLWVSET